MAKKQITFSREIGEYNGVKGYTQSEAFHLPKSKSKGRKGLSNTLKTAYDIERLNIYRDKCIAAFEKHTARHMDNAELEKINAGIAAYVKSSVSTSDELNLLKASILNAFGFDFLTGKYQSHDPHAVQIIKPSYFESTEALRKIDGKDLIAEQQVRYYIKLAQSFTKRYLGFFFKNHEIENELEEVTIYRGKGNKAYYKKQRNNNKPDKLSIFSGLHEAYPYFEESLLTSYMVINHVAEEFMIDNKNLRRTLTLIPFRLLLPNIFSSFVVSGDFDQKNDDAQFEILALPNSNDLYITTRLATQLYTEFKISDDQRRFGK